MSNKVFVAYYDDEQGRRRQLCHAETYSACEILIQTYRFAGWMIRNVEIYEKDGDSL